MKFFQISTDDWAEYLSFQGLGFEDERKLIHSLNSGDTMQHAWTTPVVSGEIDDGIPKDFASSCLPGVVMASDKAVGVLEPLLGREVEWLPLAHHRSTSYYVINVLNVFENVLDPVKSEIRYAKRLEQIPIHAMDVSLFSFDESKLGGKNIFRFAETQRNAPIVTEKVMQHIENNNLTGIRFRPLPVT